MSFFVEIDLCEGERCMGKFNEIKSNYNISSLNLIELYLAI